MAVDSGLHCTPVNEIVKDCDIISLLIPDQVMKEVYSENIEPHLTEGKTLLFSHGYNIHYNLIQPPKFINVIMAAPSGAGSELRKQFKIGKGIPGLIAVHQDYSGDSFDIALSYSKAIGLTRMGVFKSTFKEETETDLFGEQIILTGGIPKLIQSAYKVLLEANYSPVTAWFVCYYELKTIVDLFHSKGFEFMNQAISDTAEFGGITRGNRIINENVRNEMRLALEEIQSGKFHKEWMDEYERGYPQLKNMREQEKQIPIEEISKQLLKVLCENK
jgi:ketol-acid reductoisomerase